jgi:carbonic anhydrase
MRLFEAIIEANHRAAAGDDKAGLHPADFADSLPVTSLTCIDTRLNPLIPEVLGIPEEHFIWLRNAGNIITGPLSSTMRSLALACAVKGAREIVIIGHTDCQVCKTTTLQLLERFKSIGVGRNLLPANLSEYFGMFASEQQNVIKACDFVRQSPLIGPQIPVHGLLVDIGTGRLEWLVNGYQTFATMSGRWNEAIQSAGETVDKLKSLADFQIGEMKFPETRIGEAVTKAGDWLSQKVGELEVKQASSPAVNIAKQVVQFAETHWPKPGDEGQPASGQRLKVPLPPRIRPKPIPRQGRK